MGSTGSGAGDKIGNNREHKVSPIMNATGHTSKGSRSQLQELPEFELGFHLDEDTDPGAVTIFRPGTDDEAAAQWITIDATYSVSIDAIQ